MQHAFKISRLVRMRRIEADLCESIQCRIWIFPGFDVPPQIVHRRSADTYIYTIKAYYTLLHYIGRYSVHIAFNRFLCVSYGSLWSYPVGHALCAMRVRMPTNKMRLFSYRLVTVKHGNLKHNI